MLALTSNPFLQDLHVDLFRVFSVFVDNGMDSCTVFIFKKEYPRGQEVCTDLLRDVAASSFPSEPD